MPRDLGREAGLDIVCEGKVQRAGAPKDFDRDTFEDTQRSGDSNLNDNGEEVAAQATKRGKRKGGRGHRGRTDARAIVGTVPLAPRPAPEAPEGAGGA